MIEIRNLRQAIEHSQLYRGLNLKVSDRRITVILGKSGVGKSILLKHILGLQIPESGEILIEGTDITEMERHDRRDFRLMFGMVFQHSALLDSLTVADNVSLGMRKLTDYSEQRIRDRMMRCLEAVQLSHAADLLPEQLSGGMRKRVAFARAIAMKPKYLLYDEPTGGLDPVTGRMIGDLIIQFREDLDTTSLVVTHDVALALKIADVIAILDDGLIQTTLTRTEFRRSDNPLVRRFRESLILNG